MTLGELILNIIVKINDGDVKVNSLNDSLKLSENQMKSVSSTSVSLSGALQNIGLRFDGLKNVGEGYGALQKLNKQATIFRNKLIK